MRTRTIGSGDVCLTRSAARGVEADEVARCVQQAIEGGVEVVECADEDGAERVCGDAVRVLRARDRVVVATRVPVAASAVATARGLQARVEATLRATRLEALPLAMIAARAAWREDAAWPELVGTCARLVHDGKVIAWGAVVASDDVAVGAAPWLAEVTWLAAVRVEMSLCARAAATLVEALSGKLAVLVARPVAGGALAGAIGAGTTWKLRDDRRGIAESELARVARGVAALSAFTREVPPAADAARLAQVVRVEPIECGSVAELALRWAMDRSGGVVLPRLHRSDHVASALVIGAAPPLSRDLMKRLDELDI